MPRRSSVDDVTRPPFGPTHLPGWPRGLRLLWAAAYVGLAPSTFLREVAEDRAPKPVPPKPGCKVKIWLREHLDRHLDELAAAGEDQQAPNPWDRPAP